MREDTGDIILCKQPYGDPRHNFGDCWKSGGTSINIMSQRDLGAKPRGTDLYGLGRSPDNVSAVRFSSNTGLHREGGACEQLAGTHPPLAGSEPEPGAFAQAAVSAGTHGPRPPQAPGLAPSVIQVSVQCHLLQKPFLAPQPKSTPQGLSLLAYSRPHRGWSRVA